MKSLDRLIRVPLETVDDRFIAARVYLATLAFPESHAYRQKACVAARDFLHRWARESGGPTYPLSTVVRDMYGPLQRMDRRLRWRLEAAAAFVKATRSTFRRDGGSWTNLAMRSSLGKSKFFTQAVCRYQVTHLGLALADLKWRWTDKRPFSIGWLLALAPEWIEGVIDQAETVASWRTQFASQHRGAPWDQFAQSSLLRIVRVRGCADFGTD
jgi:hypothetical protein